MLFMKKAPELSEAKVWQAVIGKTGQSAHTLSLLLSNMWHLRMMAPMLTMIMVIMIMMVMMTSCNSWWNYESWYEWTSNKRTSFFWDHSPSPISLLSKLFYLHLTIRIAIFVIMMIIKIIVMMIQATSTGYFWSARRWAGVFCISTRICVCICEGS